MTKPWKDLRRRDFSIELTVAGPVLSQSTGMRQGHLDAAFARSGGPDGKPVLPGSHIAGHLSDAWEALLDADLPDFRPDPAHWLGRASEQPTGRERKKPASDEPDTGSNDPIRKRLVIHDLVMCEEPDPNRARPRIALDAAAGATKAHALQIIEEPVPAGPDSQATFRGTAYAIGTEEKLLRLEGELRVGLRAIGQLGANKGIGFGALKAVSVTGRFPAPQSEAAPREADRVAIIIKPQHAMLFARRLAAGNTFESLDEIPGAAIKGAIAELAAALGATVDKWAAGGSVLSRHFDLIRFGHAFPALAGCYRRPVRPPLSLVRYEEGEESRWADTALIKEPEPVNGRALEYAPDWKPGFAAGVREHFGWASPNRELRVRTAIDPHLRRAAEARLFAHETILNKARHNDTDYPLAWYGYVDFSDIESRLARNEAIAELHDLLQCVGLVLLGKTKASAEIELRHPDSVLPAVAGGNEPLCYVQSGNSCWIVTLQTDAVAVPCDKLGPAATAKCLKAAYADFWQDVSGGTLCLVDYFAQQKLAGGGYLWHRFLKNAASAGDGYVPIALTEAGSVFVLEPATDDAAARKTIEAFAIQGLPLPKWAKERYWPSGDPQPADWSQQSEAPLWRTLPYLRQNGYGEVAINLATHTECCPWLLMQSRRRSGEPR